jgi:hypothetical protein
MVGMFGCGRLDIITSLTHTVPLPNVLGSRGVTRSRFTVKYATLNSMASLPDGTGNVDTLRLACLENVPDCPVDFSLGGVTANGQAHRPKGKLRRHLCRGTMGQNIFH